MRHTRGDLGVRVLHIHRAERSDLLVAALADVLREPADDPMVPEVVAVPTRGVERWIAQQLSSRLGAAPGAGDGICAGIEFPFPGQVLGAAVARATEVDPSTDPWRPERLVWPLLEVVEDALGEPWLATLAAHLGAAGPAAGSDAGPSSGRRFSAVRHIAVLFDRYAVHRPAMLLEWAQGADTSGDGAPLPADLRWQPQLWRRLRARLAAPSPAEQLGPACARLEDDPDVLAADRLCLYGLTRLPPSQLTVLRALAARRDVHLFLLHPSPALWGAIAASGEARGPVRRPEDLTAGTAVHPLLRSWGRDARELQLLLPSPGREGARQDVRDVHHPAPPTGGTLLQQLQADIRDDRAPAPRVGVDPADGSIQVHSCHGRARQVEVLRDAVLHLLAQDASLEPRDVIVMCPDIEAFAPLVHAAFGGTGTEDDDAPATDLQVRLADRALRQTNPLLGLVAAVLDLASSRATASGVLDVAGREPVRMRFRLTDEDLARAQEWIAATGIRWGLDAEHRGRFKLDAVTVGTWRAGLDRVLVGVAMREEGQDLVGGVLPLDDVGSGDVDLVGRLAELLDRLESVIVALSRPQTVESWVREISRAVDLLASRPGGRDPDAWQRMQLQRVLDDVVDEAAVDGVVSSALLVPTELRDLLAERLRGRPTRAGFRTGHLTVCTLAPMRSVPHRVVCLLGLDDGVFPRRTAPDGDDLVARDPRVGDHDPRSEDRQLLLDAVLAATDHLVVTYAGRDERTNAPRPPAVPVGELLDVVEVLTGTPRDRLVVRHPLQPFDERNFTEGELVPARPWSFDGAALHGAQALAGPREEPRPFLAGPLPPKETGAIELDALVRFLQHPVKAFLRERLGIVVTEADDDVEDAMPVELDKLEEWALGQRLLEARLTGAAPERCTAAEVARGVLPPGALGRPVVDRIGPIVDGIVAAVHDVTGGTPHDGAAEVDVALPDGSALVGTVTGVHAGRVLAVTYSKVAAKHRLAAWVRALALTAAAPEHRCEAVTVGRSARRHADVTVARVPAGEGGAAGRREAALTHLAGLAELYRRGMREPLPLYCRTSAAYVEAVRVGRSAEAAVRREWQSGWRFPGEDADPEHELVLGAGHPVEEVLAEAPRRDESGPGWPAEETCRLGRYARRLWDPLLDREVIEHR